jgi:1-acyl-sn-glycerol-3-phosphate acyltransferase
MRGWPKVPKDFGFRVLTMCLRPLVGLLLRPAVTGKEHVPADGPLIVASNHLSAIDTLCLAVLLPRKVTFLAKNEYFTRSGIRGWFMARLISTCGFVRVDRSSPAAGKAALAAGLRVLLRQTTDEVMNAIADLSRQQRGVGYAGLGRATVGSQTDDAEASPQL